MVSLTWLTIFCMLWDFSQRFGQHSKLLQEFVLS
jgi:hypothetical protein